MLSVKMTPHLLGIEVEGDYAELDRLYDAIWEVVDHDYDDDPHVSMQAAIMRERLLALCYDLRHAYMGTRNIHMEDNGMDREMAKLQGISLPPLQNLYYSVEILYPEAMYEVMVLGNLVNKRRAKLIKKVNFSQYDANDPRVLFDRSCALVVCYQSLVMEAVRSVTSPNTFSRIRKQVAEGFHLVPSMYTQWLDIINCDWCNLSKNQRKSKLSTAVRDISDFWNDQKYLDLRADIDEYVRQSGAALVNVRMSDLEYPETYEW